MNYHEEDILGKAFDSRLMKRLLTYVWPFKSIVLLAFLILLVIAAAELAGPYIIKIAIDRDIADGNVQSLLQLCLLYLMILFVRALGEYSHRYLTSWLGQHVMKNMRLQLFSHIQNLPLSYFDRNPVGRLVTRVTNDIETLNELLSSGLVAILGDFVVLFGIILVLLNLNPELALITFIVLPPMILVTILFRSRIRKVYRKIRIRIARINSFLQENIAGMSTIQIFNRQEENQKRFTPLNDQHRQAHLQSIRYYAFFYPLVSLLTSISTACILWYGGIRVLETSLSLGILVAFMQYVRRFFQPLQDLADKFNVMQAAMASSERVFALLDEPQQQSFHPPRHVLPPEPGKIEFKNVSFSYDGQEYVLKNVSFTIHPGEKVAVVGATGAGKTTIINLINRMYEVTSGEITLDDVNIATIPLAELRSRIGVVLQDVFVFSGSPADNISLSSSDISQEDVIRAAKRVNVHKFIESLPNGYQHIIKERGSNLSVGQKQLLSFARALAYNPELLILDEATSSVDTATELLISKAIHELMLNRTSIIIAHRLSTIKDVDRIIVLHKGHIKEIGTHEALLAQKGVYYRLYQLQFKSEAA